MDVGGLVADYGFPAVMEVGMGYFIYYVWAFINSEIAPQLKDMHMALIRVIDQVRMFYPKKKITVEVDKISQLKKILDQKILDLCYSLHRFL